jgi:tetratricopeptide (TPR) repeat protein
MTAKVLRLPAAARLPLLLAPALALGLGLLAPAAWPASHGQLVQLLERRDCRGCRLQDADLVHADLRDAQLEQAQLQRANLSRARLDGANLRGANLSFSSLLGASLRGADLRGARLDGADLRRADLSGALLDANALARSHWQGAIGVSAEASSYAALHNAGVEAALAGRFPEAEEAFNQALLKQSDAAITWVARGLTRVEMGQRQAARQDLTHAASLYEQEGNTEVTSQLRASAERLGQEPAARRGNGMGTALLQGAAQVVQVLGPLALKFFVPTPF